LDLLLLTVDPHPESVLPSLSLLAHNVRTAPTEVSSLLEGGHRGCRDRRRGVLIWPPPAGCVACWGRQGRRCPSWPSSNEGGLVGRQRRMGTSTRFCWPSTGPAEIDASACALFGGGVEGGGANQENLGKISLGELVIDEGHVQPRGCEGRPLDPHL